MNRMHLLAIVSILTIIGIGLCYGSYEIEVMADGSTSQISATDGASSIASILDTHDKAETTGTKLFKGDVLCYVTPWNRGGYAATLRHACKLNFVSPTWFTLTFQHGKFIVTGDHDVDREWLHAMRSQNDPASTTSNPSSGCVSRTKIVPRVLSQLTGPALSTLLSSKEAQLQCIIALLDYVTRLGLDGLTLEMTEAWQAVGNNTPARKALNTFIKRLGKSLHTMMSRRYDFILVVRPPFPGSLFFQASDAAAVGQSVDRYSLMTYDYAAYASERDVREYISQATKEQDASHVEGKVSSNPILGIPNAPLPWVKSSLSAFAGATSLPTSPTQSEKKILAKTLVGLQFYGNKYGPLPTDHSTVLGHEFISAVRSSREQPSWIGLASESYLVLPASSQTVWYPTSRSLHARIKATEDLGAGGVSIWECGQGLESFFDTF